MYFEGGSTSREEMSRFVVFLIDTDHKWLAILSNLLQTGGYRTKTYCSPEIFFGEHDPSVAGCILVDLTPSDGVLNVELLRSLREIDRPIIGVSAHGDVTASVQAMKSGTIDFLLKPVCAPDLYGAIELAQQRDQVCAERRFIHARLEKLTPRESEVLAQIVLGRQSKQIAHALGIKTKTVKVHRSNIRAKLDAKLTATLVRMMDKVSLQPF
ncbi:MAG TPA: LuxR C-terminal-related transcriptional regulator [Pseudolabrys sp.]|nr:LuxR C-terminal-related transcriptional regulator [Pseudolabrys sp.]